MSERHFSAEHAQKLRDIFTKLSDFIEEYKLEQIVSCGPSSTPYIRAIARAYKNRHGVSLKVVPLGHLGEELSWFRDGEESYFKDVLAEHRNFDFTKPTLLIDEVVGTGFRFNSLHVLFERFSVPHKTAALLVHDRTGQCFTPHFIGEKVGRREEFEKAVFLKRGAAFGLSGFPKQFKRPSREWIDKMKRVRKELREIADSVSPVNK